MTGADLWSVCSWLLGVGGHDGAAGVVSALLDDLRTVDWEKGQHWVGIAGAYTASGIFSVKGTKEVAYAVFSALTDTSNGGYRHIRQQRARTAAADVSTAHATPTEALSDGRSDEVVTPTTATMPMQPGPGAPCLSG